MTTEEKATTQYLVEDPASNDCQQHSTRPMLSLRTQKKPKPPPLSLDPDAQCWPLVNPLAEFAEIATSPQSPLVQTTMCDGAIYDITTRDHYQANSCQSHSLVNAESSRMNDSGSFSYSPTTFDAVSPLSGNDSDLPACDSPSCSWSASLWQRLTPRMPLQYEDIPYRGRGFSYFEEAASSSACPTRGLQREQRKLSNDTQAPWHIPHDIKEVDLASASKSITLANKATVEDSWTPFQPNKVLGRRGITCRELLLGDICIPLTRSDDVTTPPAEAEEPPIPEKTKSVLFDLDSAAHALSSMAKRKEQQSRYQRKVKSLVQTVNRKRGSAVKRKRSESLQAKRPMNAFMLFARRYRVEITQKHPGKDNRAISVILGDQWKSLSSEDRKTYIVEAKLLADEHKRIYPDCWKRKRVSQVSSTNARKS